MDILVNTPSLRSLTWRIARKLYCIARRDIGNAPETNGEYWLLAQVLATNSTEPTILFDIGANKGDWSHRALKCLTREKFASRVYAFEPTASTFAHLRQRFADDARLTAQRIALSDRSREIDLFVVGDLAGTNSLYDADGARREKVGAMKFDQFLLQKGIDRVRFVKSDTEGHDLNVLRGAEESLRQGKVDIWQFEYNHRWINGRAVLKDVFDLVEDKPYRIGKLYGNGVETFERWHPELDRYFEANYVLVRNGSGFERLCNRVRFDARNVLVPAESQ